jgi:hypothetical protein
MPCLKKEHNKRKEQKKSQEPFWRSEGESGIE